MLFSGPAGGHGPVVLECSPYAGCGVDHHYSCKEEHQKHFHCEHRVVQADAVKQYYRIVYRRNDGRVGDHQHNGEEDQSEYCAAEEGNHVLHIHGDSFRCWVLKQGAAQYIVYNILL